MKATLHGSPACHMKDCKLPAGHEGHAAFVPPRRANRVTRRGMGQTRAGELFNPKPKALPAARMVRFAPKGAHQRRAITKVRGLGGAR